MKKFLDTVFVRGHHVCPSFLCWTFDNRLRRLIHPPEKILKEIATENDKVLDIGPGQGYFTIPLAHIVGNGGKVTAIDIQVKMLEKLKVNVQRAGLENIIECKLVNDTNWDYENTIDSVLTFWMVHEVPDTYRFLSEIYKSLKRGGKYLIAEPIIHVTKKSFEETVAMCADIGFKCIGRPKITFSNSAIFAKE